MPLGIPFYYDIRSMIYVIPFLLLSIYAQYKINANYSYYSQIRNQRNLSGAEVARIILDNNNLHHVVIKQTPQQLGDHYDPRDKTISLSPGVYSGNSIAAASIAAHEVGHAIQHARAYVPLKLRSAIAPLVTISSNLVWVFIMLGFIISPFLIDVGIYLFISIIIFQVITLPVEFNASRRAIKQLENGLISSEEVNGAKKVLSSAALTYIAATLVSVGQLLRILSMTGRRRND